jgi:hypothetical protein
VRSSSATTWAITVCSSGRKTLTSPPDGLSVPTKAITSSGQKASTPAKPSPVTAIRRAAASKARRLGIRYATSPRPSVNRAEPSRVAVETIPTPKASYPRRERWSGSRIAT